MADNSAILKEYLVALGFKIDQNGLNKMDSALSKSTKTALGFAGILAGAATAAFVFVDKVTTKLDDLYWSSVRLHDGAANIQDFKLQLSKLGGTAEGAASSMEALSQALNTNPAAEGFLNNFGVQTRNAKNELLSSASIIKQIAQLPQPLWLRAKIASQFGIDYTTLMASIRSETTKTGDVVGDTWKMAGVAADEATEKGKEFHNALLDQETRLGVVASVIAYRLLPAANALLDVVSGIVSAMLWMDRVTGGLSTDMVVLATAVWGINTALKATFATTIARAIVSMVVAAAALAETLGFAGVAGAILEVGLALDTIPLLAIITAIGIATIFVVQHWSYLVSLVRDAYNWMARLLGLPQWHAPEKPKDGTGPDGQPDYREQEKGVGANSFYGAQGGPGGPPAGGGGGGGGNGAQGGSQAALTGHALAFFQKAGWTPEQAAGIVANLIAESKLDTKAVGDNGQAVGVAQWHPDRQADFKKWSGGTDVRDADLDKQLAFLQYEMTQGSRATKGFVAMMAAGANNAALASLAVTKYVEAPKDLYGQGNARAATAQQLVDNSRLAPSGNQSGGPVKIEQNNEFKIMSSADAAAVGRATGNELSRVNGDLVRNFAGAQT